MDSWAVRNAASWSPKIASGDERQVTRPRVESYARLPRCSEARNICIGLAAPLITARGTDRLISLLIGVMFSTLASRPHCLDWVPSTSQFLPDGTTRGNEGVGRGPNLNPTGFVLHFDRDTRLAGGVLVPQVHEEKRKSGRQRISIACYPIIQAVPLSRPPRHLEGVNDQGLHWTRRREP